MRASELGIPAVHLPSKEYYPECSNPSVDCADHSSVVLNVNTVVEILLSMIETNDWRASLVKAIPHRKVQNLSNQKTEYDYRRIASEEALLSLPITQLTKFEIKQALERYCIQHKMKLLFEREERDLPASNRFEVRAVVDGRQIGQGTGSNTRIAASYAAWRGLKTFGVFDQENGESASE